MRNAVLILGLAAALAGCQKAGEAAPEAGKPGARGRYVGVGIYRAEAMWGQLASPAPTTKPDPAAATLADDDHVIVVVDTATGEMRQCGNLSGHCITSNPWAKATSAQPAPAAVLKHLDQLLQKPSDATVEAKPVPAQK